MPYPLPVFGFGKELKTRWGHNPDMGRVIDEIIVPGMGDNDIDHRIVHAYAIKLLNDPQIRIRTLP
jgi:hypothetical protein